MQAYKDYEEMQSGIYQGYVALDMIRTEILQDTLSFCALQKEWTTLLKDTANDNIFLTWEWMYTWWTYFCSDRKLFLITVRLNGQLLAIAPLVTRSRNLKRGEFFRTLEFIGSGDVGSDYLNILLCKGHEHEALNAITDCLVKQNFILDFSRFDQDSLTMNAMIGKLHAHGWQSTRTTSTVSPYVSLQGFNWETFIASRGRSHRANVRRRLRNLHEDFNVIFEQISSDERRSKALLQLIDWHLIRWQKKGGSTALHTKTLLQFHEEFSRLALERGWLRLFMLWLDDRPAVSLYCFSYGNKYSFYQMGFDEAFLDYSIGLVGSALAIQSALEEQATEYDFLHGDESYKYLWTQNQKQLLRVDLFPSGISGAVYQQSMFARYELKRMLCFAQSQKTV